MDYKKSILEAIDQLEAAAPKESKELRAMYDNLRATANAEHDQKKLFHMYQHFREIIARETKTDAKIKVKLPDGSVKEFDSLDEYHKKSARQRASGRLYRHSN